MADLTPRTFFAEMFGDALTDGRTLELRCISRVDEGRRREFYDDLDAFMEAAARQDPGWDIYFSVNPRNGKRGTADAVAALSGVWADVDDKGFENGRDGALEAVRAFPLRPTAVVVSGHGLQPYWLFKEPETLDDPEAFRAVLRGVQRAVGSDPVDDLPRVLRVPGTKNFKDPEAVVDCRLIFADYGRRYSPSDFEPYAVAAETNGDRRRADPVDGDIHEKNRNNVLFSLAGTMRRRGLSEEAIRAALTEENARRCKPPLSADEVADIARKAARYEPAEAGDLVLSPADPLPTARTFLGLRYDRDGRLVLRHWRGDPHAWTGTCWVRREESEVRAELYDFLEAAKRRTKDGELVPFQPTAQRVFNVLDAVRALGHLSEDVETPAWLGDAPDGVDADDLLAGANGLLHLPTQRLLDHTPDFFSHTAIPAAYDLNAECPTWRTFLKELWPEDPQSIATLAETFGYFLTPDTRQHKIFLIVGPKRAGKGTVARVLSALLGPRNVAAPTLAGLAQNFGLAPLIGKRAAIISDARLGGRTDQHAIAERLLSISGEDLQTIDRKHRDPWTGRLRVRFLILSNELPRLADMSGSLASRFIAFALTESFYGREDQDLTNKLLLELPGILNWSIDGWIGLQERGHFTQPVSSADAVRDMEDLSSPVAAFVRDMCVVGPEESVERGVLYGKWRAWSVGQGRQDNTITNRATFGRDLRSVVPNLRRAEPRVDGERENHYQGVGLK